jgi:hypothetical protein
MITSRLFSCRPSQRPIQLHPREAALSLPKIKTSSMHRLPGLLLLLRTCLLPVTLQVSESLKYELDKTNFFKPRAPPTPQPSRTTTMVPTVSHCRLYSPILETYWILDGSEGSEGSDGSDGS